MPMQRRVPTIDPFTERVMLAWAALIVFCAVMAYATSPAKAQGFADTPQNLNVTVCQTYEQALKAAKLRDIGLSWNKAVDAINLKEGSRVCQVEFGIIYESGGQIGKQMLVAHQAYGIYQVTVVSIGGLLYNDRSQSGYAPVPTRSFPI